MKLVGAVAAAALIAGVLVWTAGRATPSGPAQPAAPTSKAPAKIPKPDVAGSSGLNVRYLGADGKTRRLDVKDFRR